MMFDADDQSFVPLLRKIRGSYIARSANLAQMWLYLLTDAEYYPRTVKLPVGRSLVLIELQLGETFIQTAEVAKYLCMAPATLRHTLMRLRDGGSITLEPTRGGYKVTLAKAREYWFRRGEEPDGPNGCVTPVTSPISSVNRNVQRNPPQAESVNETACGIDEARREVQSREPLNSDLSPGVSPCPAEDQEMKGLTAPLRIIEQLHTVQASSNSSSPTPSSKGHSVVLSGGQLDLLPPDPVEAENRDAELEVAAFFAVKEEPKWNAVQKNPKWIRAILEANPDVKWVLQELARYYQWWVENPKKRRPRLEASIGNWLRGEARKLAAAPARRAGYSIPAPSEPSKYDGIGVVNSEFDLS